MEQHDEVPKIPVFPAKPGSLFSFSFSDHRSVHDRHRPSSTIFNADGISISDVGRPPTRDSYRRRFHSRNSSQARSRIMDRGRGDYASYFTHTARPSRSSNRFGFGARGDGDQISIRQYLSSVYEPPRFEMEQQIREEESIPPRTAKDGELLRDKAQTTSRRRATIFVHILLATLFTGWWIASLLLHRKDMDWVIPMLLWMAIMIRLITFHVWASWLMRPIYSIWEIFSDKVVATIPRRFHHPISGVLVGTLLVLGAMLSPEVEENTRVDRAVSLFGYGICIFMLWMTSRNRHRVDWHTVIVGILLQFVIALLVLRTKVGYNVFNWISRMCRQVLGYSDLGLAFLTDAAVPRLPWLLVTIITPLVFFAGLAQVLSYWAITTWFVRKSATLFWWAMRGSGVEGVVASASPFLGMFQAVLLVQPFLPHITNAELHQIMCSGFATMAGGALVAYIDLGVSGEALISSCAMSVPISFVVSKLRYPELEEPFAAQYVVISESGRNDSVNFMHAFTNGVWLGLRITGIVIAILSGVIALIGLIDALLGWWGAYINIGPARPLTLELILSYLLYPIAFLLGVPRNGDLLRVSRLAAIKILKNEFTAYNSMQTDQIYTSLSSRSRLIATYSLCGFGNLGALGAQIGILSHLAPERSSDIAKVAGSAWITGIISTLLTASMAGFLFTK